MNGKRNKSLTLLLGYPIRLRFVESKKTNWSGFFLDPVFLIPFQVDGNEYTLADDLPQINPQIIKQSADTGSEGAGNVVEELLQLNDELGLGDFEDEQPDFDEVLGRLHAVPTPDWGWQEEMNPYSLSTGTPLPDLEQRGIFNRAVIIATERKPFTKGLEVELDKLRAVEESKYRSTVLGAFNGRTVETEQKNQQLLEVLPLNGEQRQAVQQALSNPFTVITGPPGTGKSQVVTSILVNAAWQNKTVLFASKNHKAIDVVETRVNALGPRPILLRLGNKEFRASLADYIVGLLAAKSIANDETTYREYDAINIQLKNRSNQIDDCFNALLCATRLTGTTRGNSASRDWREYFCSVKKCQLCELNRDAAALKMAIGRADKKRQHLVSRLFWRLIYKHSYAQLKTAGDAFRPMAKYIGMPIPETGDDLRPLSANGLNTVSIWMTKFSEVMMGKAIGFNLGRIEQTAERTNQSTNENLWKACYDSARLTPEERQILHNIADDNRCE